MKIVVKLQELEIEVYIPAYLEERSCRDRRKKVRVPCFASSVLVRPPEREQDRAFCRLGLLPYLLWLGTPATVKDQEIPAKITSLQGREKQSVLLKRLSTGDNMVLLRDPLKGWRSHIKAVFKSRVRLVLPALGYKVTAKLSDMAPLAL